MQVALVHDYLNQYGGAERVVEVFHRMYPDAPIYTSIYDREGMATLGFKEEGKTIITSFMQRMPLRKRLPRYYFTLFYPFAFRHFDLSAFDTIISSASYAAKYVKKPKGAVHICYCHTPPRFLYGYDTDISVSRMNPIERWLAALWRSYLYRLDQKRAQEVDVWVANSLSIKQKIRDAYGKEAIVVYPPVDLKRFDSVQRPVSSVQRRPKPQTPNPKPGEYFFVVSRLGEYKRVDLIVKAFNKIGWPLEVVGRGPQAPYLKEIAADNVHIHDALPDNAVTEMYHNCRALVLASDEDFGITPIEAMACGKPVIALGKGGYLETVIEGETGTFFPEQTEESLIHALKRFDSMTFDPKRIRHRAEEFSIDAFEKNMGEVIANAKSKEINNSKFE